MIQGKLAYLNANENKSLINAILPQKAAVAEEEGDAFIFSDVQRIMRAVNAGTVIFTMWRQIICRN